MKMNVQKLKILFFLLSIVVLLSSCQSLQFDRAPGIAQNEFPENIRGKYEFFNNVLKKDTLIIWVGKNSLTQIDGDNIKIDFLDSTHIYSTYKGNKFYFQKEASGKWMGFLMSESGKDLKITPYIALSKNDAQKNFKLLKKYFSSVEITEANAKDKKADFNIKMNEEELIRFTKKIKKQNVILKRVQ